MTGHPSLEAEDSVRFARHWIHQCILAVLERDGAPHSRTRKLGRGVHVGSCVRELEDVAYTMGRKKRNE